MKRISWVVLGLGLWVAGTVPVDLRAFTIYPTDPADLVTISGISNDAAAITEDYTLVAAVVGLYQDAFAVGTSDTSLTFGYEVLLDAADPADTFQFIVRSSDLSNEYLRETLTGVNPRGPRGP